MVKRVATALIMALVGLSSILAPASIHATPAIEREHLKPVRVSEKEVRELLAAEGLTPDQIAEAMKINPAKAKPDKSPKVSSTSPAPDETGHHEFSSKRRLLSHGPYYANYMGINASCGYGVRAVFYVAGGGSASHEWIMWDGSSRSYYSWWNGSGGWYYRDGPGGSYRYSKAVSLAYPYHSSFYCR